MLDDTKTICITDDDSVEGLADKIKNSIEPKINFVAFSHSSSVLSVINLKLLKKIAEDRGKSLAVSTNDSAVKMLVEKTGVTLNFLPDKRRECAARIVSVQTENFSADSGRSARVAGKNPKSVDSIGPGKRFSPQEGFLRRPIAANENYSSKKISDFTVSGGSKKLVAVFLAMAIIVAGGAGYILLPSASVIITPKTQPLSANFELVLNKNITVLNRSAKEIPSIVMVADIEKSSQFVATGRKEVSAKAAGVVTVYNECSTTPRSLKTNNQLLAANGKMFYTTKGIVVPGMIVEDGVVIPGSIEVPIVAEKAGAEYNIDPTDFTFVALRSANCQKITAKSITSASGGALGYATVVSESDMKKAQEFLESEVRKDLTEQFDEKKPSDLVLVPGAVSVKNVDLSASAKIDQVANKFQATLKTSAIAFLFNPAYAKEIAKDIFKGNDQESGDYVVLDPHEITYSSPQVLSSDKIKLSVEARSVAYRSVDAGKIKAKLLGKSKEEVESYIKGNAPEIDKVKISLWPFWVKKIPILERSVSATVLLDNNEGE